MTLFIDNDETPWGESLSAQMTVDIDPERDDLDYEDEDDFDELDIAGEIYIRNLSVDAFI
jgi:hypothetical protein